MSWVLPIVTFFIGFFLGREVAAMAYERQIIELTSEVKFWRDIACRRDGPPPVPKK